MSNDDGLALAPARSKSRLPANIKMSQIAYVFVVRQQAEIPNTLSRRGDGDGARTVTHARFAEPTLRRASWFSELGSRARERDDQLVHIPVGSSTAAAVRGAVRAGRNPGVTAYVKAPLAGQVPEMIGAVRQQRPSAHAKRKLKENRLNQHAEALVLSRTTAEPAIPLQLFEVSVLLSEDCSRSLSSGCLASSI
jgi:hypothetical protein